MTQGFVVLVETGEPLRPRELLDVLLNAERLPDGVKTVTVGTNGTSAHACAAFASETWEIEEVPLCR